MVAAAAVNVPKFLETELVWPEPQETMHAPLTTSPSTPVAALTATATARLQQQMEAEDERQLAMQVRTVLYSDCYVLCFVVQEVLP